MPDMLVALYNLPDARPCTQALAERGIAIRRAFPSNKRAVVDWVLERSGPGGASECEVAFSHTPVSCFLATQGSEIVGYACYNTTAPDFFGPTRVADSHQGQGIGKALLLHSLYALRACGYGYAIIGGIGPQAFYEKTVGAILIPDSTPGIYKDTMRNWQPAPK